MTAKLATYGMGDNRVTVKTARKDAPYAVVAERDDGTFNILTLCNSWQRAQDQKRGYERYNQGAKLHIFMRRDLPLAGEQ